MLKKLSWLIIVLLIEGAALMAVELVAAKLVAPFYGSSLYVWTSVLGFTVSGLTAGYYLGGKISQSTSLHRMLYSLLGAAALLVVAMPYTAVMLMRITAGFSLLPGICVTSLLLIFPPVLCFGMVGPLIVALASEHDENDSRIAGSVYFISTFGGIIATFIFGFYLIPFAGLKMCTTVTGVALAGLCLLALLMKQKNQPAEKRTLGNARKQITSNTTGKRATVDFVYLFAVVEGAAVMATELLAARMLAPFFGSSLDVWTSVMAFTLLGLALGYYCGGQLNAKYKLPETLWWVLLSAGSFLFLLPVLSQQLPVLLQGVAFKKALIFVSGIIILPPLVFLGMVPTLLIRHITATGGDAADITGRVFTISSASGIISLFAMGFFVIPEFGLGVPAIFMGLVVGCYPFFYLFRHKKYLSSVFVAVFIGSLMLRQSIPNGKDIAVKYYSEGLLGQVLVADINQFDSSKVSDRILLVNRIGEATIDRISGMTKWEYPIYVACLSSKLPAKSSALMLGLGGGQIPNLLKKNLDFNVDVVELDQRIADVSKEYFFLDKNVNVVVDDGRHYLETTTRKYDIIIIDVFHGDIAPPHLLSIESFAKAKSLLNKDGFIVVNFFGFLSGDLGKPGRSVYKTMVAAGLKTQILPTNKSEDLANTLFIGSEHPIDFHTLSMPLKKNGVVVDMDTMFVSPLTLDMNDAVLFTDDKTALDLLNISGAIEWRKSYFDLTQHFLKVGVPLFD